MDDTDEMRKDPNSLTYNNKLYQASCIFIIKQCNTNNVLNNVLKNKQKNLRNDLQYQGPTVNF